MKNITFDKILEDAVAWFNALPESTQKQLKQELEHGAANLQNNKQLKAYIAVYGKIHQDKLLHAFQNIPKTVWEEPNVSIIDYGAGQGIAEMVLADFLDLMMFGSDFIKDITLIEPSCCSLNRSLNYLSSFFLDSELFPLNITESQLKYNDLTPKSRTIVHLFSNVVDLDSFEGNNAARFINLENDKNHIVVCVSPYYQEETRGKRMEAFGNKLDSCHQIYKLEKHTDDWDKPYSCQIHIYVSKHYHC